MTSPHRRPEPTEYLPYYQRYVSQVPNGDILVTLEKQLDETQRVLRPLPEQDGAVRYEPGKWSLKQVIGHMADSERIFAHRALCFGRGDNRAMEGFEPDDYMAGAAFDAVPLRELVRELEQIRRSTLLLFRHLAEPAWERRGTASGGEVSVRALAWITAGHERHHMAIIRDKYLDADR